ncbi:hypothetical protein KFL_000150400 [Klebsormidium nitens]|uniref:Uncharacterized protein n=1 Tax=Klebsormidium nitens TaxID=105231 RepID=A0A1Y1HPP6_KLENI|nr:hypothetical protein KFL_000150400 [Klebsormidium nitens]|eukprot:GAQ78586.1 hypothetical protein KFL_000150400 [Klebsormidium nitens]
MTSRDLLGVTNAPPGVLLLAQQTAEDRARPNIGPVAESSILSRLKNFLPEMAQANAKLEDEMKDKPRESFDIEADAGENDEPHIEMDLALGVAELKTPEALAAAERAMNGQSCGPSDRHEANDEDESSEEEGKEGTEEDSLGSVKSAGQTRQSEPESKGRQSKKRSRIQELG